MYRFPECHGRAEKHNKRDDELHKYKPKDFEKYPWFKKWLVRKILQPAKRRVAKDHAMTADKNADWSDDDFLRESNEEADVMRMQFNLDYKDELAKIKHFRVNHRGTAWTAIHKKKNVDEIRGESNHADARKFLLAYGLQETFAATINVYGRDESAAIAYAWCHRMQYVSIFGDVLN